MSSGSLSSDLVDTWHHGLPMSPRWAGGLELGTDDNSENTAEVECEDWSSDGSGRGVGRAPNDYISEVRESSFWLPLCDCLTPGRCSSLTHDGFKVI